MKVGTKELKNRLSEYLRRVKRGSVVQVTDRGKVVAEIRPVPAAKDPDEAVLNDLAAEGVVTRGKGAFRDFAPVPLARRVLVSRWIIEDRR
ncbi:MAG: type II toxin-antitoxin system Phd/YefM family antitoxin [Candidatus Binatia bacterium]